MGLDMYMHKTKRVPELISLDYRRIANYISEETGPFVKDKNTPIPTFDFEKVLNIPNANQLQDLVRFAGEHMYWLSIFTEVATWRKANHIHVWFVEHIQAGQDDCGMYEVNKHHLEILLDTVTRVLNALTPNNQLDEAVASKLLPTQTGFFFGGTEYDMWYLQDTYYTKEILEHTLATVDFDQEILFYSSSW